MSMLKSALQADSGSQILASLLPADFRLLEENLTQVELHVPKQLEAPDKRIDHIYFFESGFASVVANGRVQRPMEIALIGREGMTGLAVIMGHDRSPNDTYVQLSGAGQQITAAHLRQAIGQSVTLHHSLLRYGHAFHIQATQTALINGRCTVEERLARWLLMAHDRIDGDELFLTHEFLSIMLGVRRASITETLRMLADGDLIAIKRRTIAIIDRARLQKRSNGAYVPVEPDSSRIAAL
jgi:CRP-like cAMP-binding protein